MAGIYEVTVRALHCHPLYDLTCNEQEYMFDNTAKLFIIIQ